MNIHEYTEQAVRKYLRNVLFVDDQLFPEAKVVSQSGESDLTSLSPAADTFNQVEGVEQGKSQTATLDDKERLEKEFPSDFQEETDTSLISQPVIDGFAKQGIVCGLYQPSPSDLLAGEDLNHIIELCKNVDVFIIDWKLKNHDSKGLVTLELLERLFKDDERLETPKPIRFCGIYTNRRLGSVYGDLLKAIHGKWPSKCIMEDRSKWLIRLEGITIRLYRKNNQTEAEGEPTRFVAPGELAEEIIRDFVLEYESIMSATALRGIAEVRDNAKRILDKFPKGMDAALVLHAGLTLKEKSIVSDLATLLGDEMSSILADMNLPTEDLYEMCAEFVESCDDTVFDTTGDSNLDSAFSGHVTGDSVKQYITDVYRQQTHFPYNPDGKRLPEVFKKCKNAQGEFDPNVNLLHLLKTFVERKTKESKDYDFGALSALFCQRTNYAKRKILRFGTVVGCHAQEGQNTDYYLCLMPTCDSIRLKDQITDDAGNTHQARHRFPFWKLDVVSKGGEHRTHGVYVKAQGAYFPLCAKGKIRDKIHIMDFHSQGGLVCFDESGVLTCVDGSMNFEWIAELKSAHMQRIAERVSREFSRVGLTESEWLRKQVDR